MSSKTEAECLVKIEALYSENATLRQALRDIASSEPIPTDRKAWDFCRDVAKDALATVKDFTVTEAA